jgi:restriction system protein
MAEVSRRRNGEFQRRVFEILFPYPEGLRARDVLAQLESSMTLTPWELGEFSSGGGPRYVKVVRFATVDCVKAGWLVKNKGSWYVTELGRQAYAKYSDPDVFAKEALRLYREWRKSKRAAEITPEVDATEATIEKEVSVTYEQSEEQAWSEISSFLTGMQPYDFQEIVASLLRAMGYHIAWVSPPGKDGGIDVLAWSDPLGARPPRIKVQVKRQASKVSVDGLRSFMALLGDDDIGLFVCTGGFTKDAADDARSQPRRKITLLDLESLFDLWVEFYSKLDEDGKGRLPLRPIYFLAPQD